MRSRIVLPVVMCAALSSGALLVAGCARHAPAPATPPPAAEAPKPAAPPPGRVHHLASGLVYEDLVVGTGKMADPGLLVSVHYTGWLADGTKFQSSYDSGQPFHFAIGAHQVIAGWDEGVKGMRVGGRRKLTIPPDLAYGSQGRGALIPPNATLVFEVELISVE